jgi:hypothetical protein
MMVVRRMIIVVLLRRMMVVRSHRIHVPTSRVWVCSCVVSQRRA